MKFIALAFASALLLTSCSYFRKKLNEKNFRSRDISVDWYRISEITTIHDFVDLNRWGHSQNIMETNTNIIDDVVIKGDTVVIKTNSSFCYFLAARSLQCYIRLDSSLYSR